jgi:hypothetical protein
MPRRRHFLVPVGMALAALAPGAASSHSDPVSSAPVGNDGAARANLKDRLRQPLLALRRGGGRQLAGATFHSSHSSHASHASHASHFSSSVTSQPVVTLPSAPAAPVTSATATISAYLSASQEVPPPQGASSLAMGTFTATLKGRILSWQLTTSSLSGSIVAAVIHIGQAGRIGPRLVQIVAHAGTSASGTVVLSPAQVAALLGKSAYLNVGTHLNPGGEIRGQLMALATPATVSGGSGSISGGGHVSHASHASHASHVSHYSSY